MIEIGEFVRTEYGYILENTIGSHGDVIKELEEGNTEYIYKYGKIVKHSKNIIDIIEVGDFVNGIRVLQKFKNINNGNILLVCGYCEIEDSIDKYENKEVELIGNRNIINILTHEQYEENCYKVEEG